MTRSAARLLPQGAAPFSPSSLSGLAVWLDAPTLALADGAAVSSWTDLSGNTRHAVQATGGNQPTYKTSVTTPSGKACVAFNGSSTRVTGPISGLASATIFTVFKASAFNSFDRVLSLDAGANDYDNASSAAAVYFDFAGGLFGIYRNNGNRGDYPSTGSAAWHVVQQTFDQTNAIIATDGGSTSSAASAGALNPSNYTLGAVRAGGNYFTGWIASVLIYNRALNSTERGQVQTYLKARFGTP